MRQIYADLHVHLGGIKITASRNLTVAGILAECLERKGLDLVGIIDAAAPPALAQLADLVAAGALRPLAGGGLNYRERLTLILGSEVEVWHQGPLHLLCYLPGLAELREFARWQAGQVKNPGLSTQRHRASGAEVVAAVARLGGFVVPAHVFTPYKSILAAAGDVSPVLPPELWEHVPAVELGLSADTDLAQQVPQLAPFSFIANSDAHSRAKIAREYNVLQVSEPSFADVLAALRGEAGCGVMANFGLDPRLGKYHRSFCLTCERRLDAAPPVVACPVAAHHRVLLGVLDRVHLLSAAVAGGPQGATKAETRPRPPYRHQVPLQYVPGVGPAAQQRLLAAFGSEMAVLHQAPVADLARTVGPGLAQRIDDARAGRLNVAAGAGGTYGKLLLD